MLSTAYNNLDDIYSYIKNTLYSSTAAGNLLAKLEKAILSLSYFPYKGAMRKTGTYANKGYRQLFVENFIVVYRIEEQNKRVVVVTVQYKKCSF
ncbi:MAG: type II toxin-antitoxin system RelE/ParE family toxin [Faecalibacterium sp.]